MEYKISIIVQGEDRASGPLRNVGSALGNMSQIAGGILGAGLISGIAQKLKGLASEAIMATANLQQMQVGMEGLLAREIANTSNMEAMAKAADGVAASTMTIADAMPQAQSKAKAMIEELSNIAVLSPYQVETVQQTFQTALAFGYTSEEAKKYTKAILNVAAGSGAGNEQLQRMSYNFAQIRMQGRVTAVDIRQLAMAGFDLVSVLKYTGDQFGVTIKDHADFNEAIASGKITWAQFTEAFDKYAETNFGGAAERMSRTLVGLKSTMKDVLTLTMPKLLGPATEAFTGFANRVLDSILKFRNAGLLEKWGETLGKTFDKVIKVLDPLLVIIDSFFTLLAGGSDPLSALKIAIYKAFGGEGLAMIENIIVTFQEVWKAIKDVYNVLASNLVPIFEKVWKWVSENVLPLISFKDILITLGIIILSAVVPALLTMLGTLITTLAPIFLIFAAVVLLRNAWEKNWFGIRDTLTNIWNTVIYPALQTLWTWLQINIPFAIAWLSSFWTNTLLPALQNVWGFVQTYVFPIALALWNYLQIMLGNAITVLSFLWTNILWPAIQAVWDFVSTYVFPIIASLIVWLATNIPVAIQILSNFWNNTLLPAINAVWAFIQDYLYPLFLAICDFFNAAFTLALTALAGLWQNVLQPAFKAVGDYIGDKLQPIMESLRKFWEETLAPALTRVKENVLDKLKGVFEGIKEAIGWVIDKLKEFTEKLKKIKLPVWLTPGSPTPFEMALRGINKELREMSLSTLPTLTGRLSLGFTEAAGGRRAGQTVYDQRQYNLKVATTQSPAVVQQSFELMKVLSYGT